MTVSSIFRDWGNDAPAIVRMVVTDTLSAVGTTDYLLNNQASIELANNGAFTWNTNDMVLVYASNGWGFFTISADFNSLNAFAFSSNSSSAKFNAASKAAF